jgi:hypothetical protein
MTEHHSDGGSTAQDSRRAGGPHNLGLNTGISSLERVDISVHQK